MHVQVSRWLISREGGQMQCKRCGNKYKTITVSRMDEGVVGSYKTCRTVTVKKGLFVEKGCREIIWIKQPDYNCKPEADKTDRDVFVPEDAQCGKCGSPLGFYKNERGLWVPCEIDGGDHWDACRENLSTGKYGIKKTFENQRPGIRMKCTDKSLKIFDGAGVPW